MKKELLFISIVAALLFTAVGCTTEDNGNSDTSTTSSLDSYVSTKYSNGTTLAGYSQTKWNAVNCHDPKLFQDDDGTYYVYTTDASCGDIGKVGMNIRYSTDLINWTGWSKSALHGYWDDAFVAWEGFVASSSEKAQSNTAYTAYTWAPTVIKQNGLYYMYHGVNATNGTSSSSTSSITLAIASSAKGPFYPADYISSYDADTGSDTNESDIVAIQKILTTLGVTYSQSFLVRYAASTVLSTTPSIDGTAVTTPDFTQSNNKRFGCIDPEFVYDVATGKLMEYTIGSNTCYAMTYGSWMYCISLVYVDATSLKPVATTALSYTDSSHSSNSFSYALGDELNIPLDQANLANSSGSYGALGTRIAGGYGAGYEGSQLIYNSDTGYYYVFVSMGDLNYEYRVGMGRCAAIDGTYLDASGKNMLLTNTSTDTNYKGNYHAIGSKIIGAAAFNGEYSWRCPGGESIFRNSNGQIIFACHSRTNFQAGYYFYLQCRQMFFNADGWPVLNQNEYYNDYTDVTTSGKEALCSISMSDIAGTYDAILTVRGTATSAFTPYGATTASTCNTCDETPTASKSMVIDASGNITGTYTGTVTLASDGYTATIVLKDSSGTALGTFKGYFMHAVDWAREGDVERRTITFTTLDYSSDGSDAEAGEYFFGNKHTY